MYWLLIVFVAFPFAALGATCPNVSPLGYYNPTANGGYLFTFGAPPPNVFYNFELRPPWINECQLNNLHQMCVDTINEYRAGTLVFSDGQSDPTLGNPPPLTRTNVLDRCHSEAVLGDFYLMNPYCSDGAHKDAWACQGYADPQAQNLCCPNPVSSVSDVQASLKACLQQMWDEGMNPTSGSDGHYLTMKNSAYTVASCGFGFSPSGWVVISMNFGASYQGNPTITTNSPTMSLPTNQPTPPTLRPTNHPSTPPTTLAPFTPAPVATRTPTPDPTLRLKKKRGGGGGRRGGKRGGRPVRKKHSRHAHHARVRHPFHHHKRGLLDRAYE